MFKYAQCRRFILLGLAILMISLVPMKEARAYFPGARLANCGTLDGTGELINLGDITGPAHPEYVYRCFGNCNPNARPIMDSTSLPSGGARPQWFKSCIAQNITYTGEEPGSTQFKVPIYFSPNEPHSGSWPSSAGSAPNPFPWPGSSGKESLYYDVFEGGTSFRDAIFAHQPLNILITLGDSVILGDPALSSTQAPVSPTGVTFEVRAEGGFACAYAFPPADLGEEEIEYTVQSRIPVSENEVNREYEDNSGEATSYEEPLEDHCVYAPTPPSMGDPLSFGSMISTVCTDYDTSESHGTSPFTGVVVQCIEETLFNIFYEGSDTVTGETFFSRTQGRLKSAVRALLALYIIIFFYKLMVGSKSIPERTEWTWMVIKLALVIYFATGAGMTDWFRKVWHAGQNLSIIVMQAGQGGYDPVLRGLQATAGSAGRSATNARTAADAAAVDAARAQSRAVNVGPEIANARAEYAALITDLNDALTDLGRMCIDPLDDNAPLPPATGGYMRCNTPDNGCPALTDPSYPVFPSRPSNHPLPAGTAPGQYTAVYNDCQVYEDGQNELGDAYYRLNEAAEYRDAREAEYNNAVATLAALEQQAMNIANAPPAIMGAGSTTYMVPLACQDIEVEVYGGGAGPFWVSGAIGLGNDHSGGAGGYAKGRFNNVSPGQTFSAFTGHGSTTFGEEGGTTWFSSLAELYAYGGGTDANGADLGSSNSWRGGQGGGSLAIASATGGDGVMSTGMCMSGGAAYNKLGQPGTRCNVPPGGRVMPPETGFQYYGAGACVCDDGMGAVSENRGSGTVGVISVTCPTIRTSLSYPVLQAGAAAGDPLAVDILNARYEVERTKLNWCNAGGDVGTGPFLVGGTYQWWVHNAGPPASGSVDSSRNMTIAAEPSGRCASSLYWPLQQVYVSTLADYNTNHLPIVFALCPNLTDYGSDVTGDSVNDRRCGAPAATSDIGTAYQELQTLLAEQATAASDAQAAAALILVNSSACADESLGAPAYSLEERALCLESRFNAANQAVRNYMAANPATLSSTGYDYCDFRNDTYTAGFEYMQLWDMVDCKIKKYLGVGSNSENRSIPQVLLIAITAVISTAYGVPIFLFSVIFVVMIVQLTIRVVEIYIMAFLSLVLMVYISPLVIPSVLFQQTRHVFDAWLKQVFALILQPVVLFAFLSFMFVITDSVMFGANQDFNADNTINRSVNGNCTGAKAQAIGCIYEDVVVERKDNFLSDAFGDDFKIWGIDWTSGDQPKWLFFGLLKMMLILFIVKVILSSVEQLSGRLVEAMGGGSGGLAKMASVGVSSPAEVLKNMGKVTVTTASKAQATVKAVRSGVRAANRLGGYLTGSTKRKEMLANLKAENKKGPRAGGGGSALGSDKKDSAGAGKTTKAKDSDQGRAAPDLTMTSPQGEEPAFTDAGSDVQGPVAEDDRTDTMGAALNQSAIGFKDIGSKKTEDAAKGDKPDDATTGNNRKKSSVKRTSGASGVQPPRNGTDAASGGSDDEDK